jgi:hypothetical protein
VGRVMVANLRRCLAVLVLSGVGPVQAKGA